MNLRKIIKNKISDKKRIFSLVVGALILVLVSFSVVYISAWTEPSQPPPAEVIVPVNTGIADQIKYGRLNVGIATSSGEESYGLVAGNSGIKSDGDVYIAPTTTECLAKGDLTDGTNSFSIKELVEIREYFDLILPVGTIAMWHGYYGEIPSGWALCNGSSSTPNLSDRFVYGAAIAEIGLTGGSAWHKHYFDVWIRDYWTGEYYSYEHYGGLQCFQGNTCTQLPKVRDRGKYSPLCGGVPGYFAKNKKWTVSSAGGTTQKIYDVYYQAGDRVTTGTGTSMPPYIKLAFIMKTE